MGGEGKIDIFAYKDLMPAFEKWPPRNLHPNPERPGLRAHEQLPKGLKSWDQKKHGRSDGWIAVNYANDHHEKKKGKVVQHSRLRQLAPGLPPCQTPVCLLGIRVAQ